MSTSSSSKDGASKSKNDEGVCGVNDMLQKMNTADGEENDVLVCANCGKEGSDVNNICNKCKRVTYCNAVCKKKHRHKHKKDCEEYIRLATEKHNEELRIAAERHDEELFKQPPPQLGDCPICFLRLPSLRTGYRYKSCCGKVLCSGCDYAPVLDDQGNKVDGHKCPYCRTLTPDEEEQIKRLNKRVEAEDPLATHRLGCDYRDGTDGFPQDYTKALDLFHRSADLGYTTAYNDIGCVYFKGRGVEVDKQKANHYLELAAIGGNVEARHNLGCIEADEGNFDRALKHFMIAIRGGHSKSLTVIQRMYSEGHATKEDYTTALQTYQEYLGEIKSRQREEAAEFDERNRYY